MRHRLLPALAMGSLALISASADTTSDKYWPQWRGPHATGVSTTADPPLEWSETKNVRWKLEIPGRGSGTPIVWGDKVFVLTAVPAGVDPASSHQARGGTRPAVPHKFVVMAIDRKSGKVAWERTAREVRRTKGRTSSSARMPRRPPSRTANASTRSSTRSGSTPTT